MPAFTQELIRFAAQIESHDRMLNDLTSGTPVVWRGASWRFDVACFLGDTLVGVAGLSSLTLEIKPLATPAGSALISQTISDAQIDNDTTLATWEAGTAQHAYFEIPRADTNLILTASADFFLTIYGLTTDNPAKRVVIGVTTLRVEEAGISSGAPPTPGDPDYYTAAESDARYIQDIAVESPLQTTGTRSPTLSILAGSTVGQLLMWSGSAWIPGNVGGDLMVLCDDGKLCPLQGQLLNGRHVLALGPAVN